jgi:hypothetical protein
MVRPFSPCSDQQVQRGEATLTEVPSSFCSPMRDPSALEDRGEVRIREAVDFDDWAIEILVSFRQADKLTILTATHQSGGVRFFHCSWTRRQDLRILTNAPEWIRT